MSQDSAAVIIRRKSQEFETCQEVSQEDQAKASKQLQNLLDSLPFLENYKDQKKGRNPYFCISCDKRFTKSSLNSHIKTKHGGKSPKVKCYLCEQVFNKALNALDHVSSRHKVYHCPYSSKAVSNFIGGQNKGEL